MSVAVVAVPEIDLSRLLTAVSALTFYHVSRGERYYDNGNLPHSFDLVIRRRMIKFVIVLLLT